VLAKSLGTTNPINMAKATVVALKELRRPEDVARIRGKQISEVLPLPSIKKQGELEEAAAAVVAIADLAPAVEETPVEVPAEVPPPAEAEAPKPKKRAPAKPKAEPAPVEEASVAEEAPVVEAEAEPEPAVEPVAEPEAEAKPKRRLGRKKKES
jgi:hypothetical protein